MRRTILVCFASGFMVSALIASRVSRMETLAKEVKKLEPHVYEFNEFHEPQQVYFRYELPKDDPKPANTAMEFWSRWRIYRYGQSSIA